tara:strand:- start:124 stop:303 length:180 start_codon:yes stop_codon:yes gene_type:complete
MMEKMDRLKYHKLKEKNLDDYYEFKQDKINPKKRRIRMDKGEKVKNMRRTQGKYLITFD